MLRKRILYGCAGAIAVLACLSTAQPASAQTYDSKAYFTFSGPFELPGVGLPPGRYLFRLGDPSTSRKVVQVLSGDGKKVFGQFFSIPVERMDVPSETEIRFMEAAAGAPPPVKTWWMPGDRTGREFIYPKEQARRLARNVKEPILTTQTPTTTADETKTATLERMSSSGEASQVTAENRLSSAPSGTVQKGEYDTASLYQSSSSSTAGTAGQVPAPRPVRVARAQLPRTGSQMPFVGLVGLFFLTAAMVIRFYRTRQV